MGNTRPTGTAADPRLAMIAARAAAADGGFWFAVRTTGVYCRPSCPSRRARPENIRLFDSPADARAAGFRPCRRCDPDGPVPAAARAAMVARACRAIASAEEPPPLATLAAQAGLGARQFHRLFTATTGLSPRQYAAGLRARRLRAALEQGADVTSAIHEAGFGSSGRFYEKSDDILAMRPTRYRDQGAGETLRHVSGPSSLGTVLVATSARGVVAILLGDDEAALTADLRARFAKATLIAGDATQAAHLARVLAFVENPALGLDLPLDLRGTLLQQRVWQALRAVPVGRTLSYGELARQVGAPAAVRAVASACAANPLALAVPCHRVVGADGALRGYRWGIDRKRALLARESALPARKSGATGRS